MSTSGPERYHHGSLREALIDAAIEALRQRPDAELGLRELARAVGVSTAAPYRHFASRDALLAAVCARGFLMLADALRATVAEHGPDDLAALGATYIRFALAHRSLFAVMLRHPRAGQAEAEVAAASEAAFAPLRQAVALITGRAARDETIGAWALAHGLAVLATDGRLAPDLADPARLDALVAVATGVFVRGLAGGAAARSRRRDRGR